MQRVRSGIVEWFLLLSGFFDSCIVSVILVLSLADV